MAFDINSNFDQYYDIRLATIDDIDMIMKFIDVHWRKGHIMAVNRPMFEYEYVHGDEVDFVIAVRKENNELDGIFGFLRCTKERTGDIWGSMWKVTDNALNFLGIELAKRVYPLTGCRSHIGNGANPQTTIPLRKIFFHEKTAKMKQYYWLNPKIEQYQIALVNTPWIPRKANDSPSYTLKKLNTFEELHNCFDIDAVEGIPHKDNWYVKHRFFEHPIYKYEVYGIDCLNKISAIFVGRKVLIGDSSILRIVDYIGDSDLIRGLYDELSTLVNSNHYEYIDFFEFGLPDEVIRSAGFRDREDFDNIIPNYFEPFVRENVDIWTHYRLEGTTFFKADGDQDRPNILPL